MHVDLRELRPNPLRDFTIDPIDAANVAALKSSIEEHGFWGGVACRALPDGTIEIAAGHHRVQAALEVGMEMVDLYVREQVSDAEMIRLYATENATQRGNTSTAMAGTVGSAIKFLAKDILSGGSQQLLRTKGLEEIQGNLTSERGLGETTIAAFLHGIPGVTTRGIQQQLANLKASGDYARLLAEVEVELEQEHAAAVAALEEAEREQIRLAEEQRLAEARRIEAEVARELANARVKAAREEEGRARQEALAQQAELNRQRAEAEAELAEKRRQEAEVKRAEFDAMRQQTAKASTTAHKAAKVSAERPKTFDFEGVAKHLENPWQVQVFRDIVTGIGMQSLPVDQQAALAKEVVDYSIRIGKRELTGQFIREHTMGLWLKAKQQDRQQTHEEQESLLRHDLQQRALHYQREFIKYVHMLTDSAVKLDELANDWPTDVVFPYVSTFQETVERTTRVLQKLSTRFHQTNEHQQRNSHEKTTQAVPQITG